MNIKKYKYIDVLRALAILGVIAVHCHQSIEGLTTLSSALLNYGQLGVQLFFIASAITLCLSAAARQEITPSHFYVRRFFRIAPLYYFAIIFYFLWRALRVSYKEGGFAVPIDYTWFKVAENFLFIHGFNPQNFSFIVPGGWSISTEMTFYLLFPVLFFTLQRVTVRTFILLSVLIATLSLALQYYYIFELQPSQKWSTVYQNDEYGYIYTLILNQINVFMIGIIGYKLLDSKIKISVLFIAILLIAISIFLLNDRVFDTGMDGFIYPIFSAIGFTIFTIKLSQLQIKDNFISNAVVKIGKNSFSMYISHFFVIDILLLSNRYSNKFLSTIQFIPELRFLLFFLVVVIFSYSIALITNNYIEKPGIRFGERLILFLKK